MRKRAGEALVPVHGTHPGPKDMPAVFAAYPVHNQFKDKTFVSQRGLVKEPPLPALEKGIPAGTGTTEF